LVEIIRMRLYVIIATCNRTDLLRRTFGTIAQAAIPASLERFIILENGSTGTADPVAREFGDRLPIELKVYPPGRSKAYLAELERLKDGLAIFLDDDVRVAPTHFDAFDRAVNEHGHGGVYGGAVIAEYEQAPPDWLLPYLPRTAQGWDPPDPAKDYQWFLGPNYAATIPSILEVGGFDPDTGPGTDCHVGDEMELQRRLYRSGRKRIFLKDAPVWHYVPRQRCSTEFVLNRLRQEAKLEGLGEYRPTDPRIAGLPRWLWIKLAVARLGGLRAGLTSDEQRRFLVRRPYFRWLGYRDGVQLAQRRLAAGKTHAR
jgi:GT2 family glycosyltransferase